MNDDSNPPPPVNPTPPSENATWNQTPPPPSQQSGTMDRIIPTKNPNALAAYYTGLFSLIPCLGLILAITAIICGRKGLQAIREEPGLPGKGHARFGLIAGWFWLSIQVLAIIFAIIVANNK